MNWLRIFTCLIIFSFAYAYLWGEEAVVAWHAIDGICKQQNDHVRDGRYHTFNSFQVVGKEAGSSNAQACNTDELRELTNFSKERALDLQTNFNPKTQEWQWGESIKEIEDMIVTECTILSQGKDKVALTKFDIEGKIGDGVQWPDVSASVFNLVLFEENRLKLIDHYLTFQNYGEFSGDAQVEYICDVGSDGIAEVIVRDGGYAGYSYDIWSWKKGTLTKSTVDGGGS